MTYGTDVSNHQQEFPIPYKATGWKFAYILATQGARFVNPKLVAQSQQAERELSHYGYYHYLDNTASVIDQARHFVNTIGVSECKNPKVQLWLDFEEPYLTGDEPKIFIDEVKRLTGRQCGMYTGTLQLTSPNYDWTDLPKDLPLWVAQYPSNDSYGVPLSNEVLNWGIEQVTRIPHFEKVHVWQYGGARGYDWDIMFYNPLDNSTASDVSSNEPIKPGTILTVKQPAYLYDSTGTKRLAPKEKASWFKADKGVRVKFISTVGYCYKVEYYGYTFYLHAGNF